MKYMNSEFFRKVKGFEMIDGGRMFTASLFRQFLSFLSAVFLRTVLTKLRWLERAEDLFGSVWRMYFFHTEYQFPRIF